MAEAATVHTDRSLTLTTQKSSNDATRVQPQVQAVDTSRLERTRLRHAASDRVLGCGNARSRTNPRFRATSDQDEVGLAESLLRYRLQGQGHRVGNCSKNTGADKRHNKTKPIGHDRARESHKFGRGVLPTHKHQFKRERQGLRKNISKGGNSKTKVQQGHERNSGVLGRRVARDRPHTSI